MKDDDAYYDSMSVYDRVVEEAIKKAGEELEKWN